MIFTSLSPNLEIDDVLVAVKALLNPFKYKRGNSLITLEKYFKGNKVYLYDSGRTSLKIFLNALNLSPGSEVLIQAFTCVAVPGPILASNLTPVYVDIDETLTMDPSDLKKKITKNSRVLIIQHTFGSLAKTKELIQIAKENNMFVIEDSAHALGSNLNSQADAIFYSFGRDKPISSVFGSALVVNNPNIKITKKLDYPSNFWIIQQLVHPVITFKIKVLYNFGGRFFFYLVKKTRLLSRSVEADEKQGEESRYLGKALPNALASLAVNQLKKLEKFNAHRTFCANYYDKHLLKGITRQKTTNSIYLRYWISDENSDVIYNECKKRGVLLGSWYNTPIAPEGVNYKKVNYSRNCLTAERLSKNSLNLPTHISVKEKHLRKIVKIVNEYSANK
ncbi:MAG: hypothetical protein COU06_00510 [Candidatus Harrisonbacteria bacterium CG10_big_fil_rev_8_21_14_0_10_38_8]|uniref:Aminotransferase n=1 Tax=Candidatus Harrisonbacteria bacterium CG10_big_fil_rev_8_21_14_0_10_38_8 TaxID=1974582 RepID=A0A2M6WKM3_9BACT|nr:MAG: hypothetical protein COU06_00510 [Candidatus Harrisonbacteria bacterium CG10_big_fil_rev_8_21_14_0_10_38_8]